MEMELEPRVKALPYKIKGISRESPSQKAPNVLDLDLRTHWSTGTNTKEWIVLELEEPCLLSHIRIHNKSVLEWEIAVGLRYKPEAFVKVRPRCEAPRRDMLYPVNYTPCRYVRISCLRGNPIAIFFIQLIGVSIAGLEPEFQPVVDYLLPHIMSHKQEPHDMHLQLLQDITSRLQAFLPQLESDLSNYSEASESNTRFLAMLAGPLYPILNIVTEREAAKSASGFLDSDTSRNGQGITLMVSSNFEAQPRRSRSPSQVAQPTASIVAFRPDAVFMLLRKAYKDPHLGLVSRLASRVLWRLTEPISSVEASIIFCEQPSSSISVETEKSDASAHISLMDCSSLFGDEFKIPVDSWDTSCLNILDIAAVEEGIMHVLFACASQPPLCSKLANGRPDLWSVLPLVQALLPALRPSIGSSTEHIDDSFLPWKQPLVQHALSQIVAVSMSSTYRPLLEACAGYLSSYSPAHAKAASVLIDLCSGPLAPWLSAVVGKVDLTIELLEDLLGTIQGSHNSPGRARAALKYIILALSGHVDDVIALYKEVKHKLLFLLEMLEPFLDPAITAVKNTIAFGDVASVFLDKQEQACVIALNIIRTAVRRSAVLPPLESEWRRGSAAPSVLLSILAPHMPLPPEIDNCKFSAAKGAERESSSISYSSTPPRYGTSYKPQIEDEAEGKSDVSEGNMKMEITEDASLLFAPAVLKHAILKNSPSPSEGSSADSQTSQSNKDGKPPNEKSANNQLPSGSILDVGFADEYFNLQADYLQLVNHQDCELRASEFHRLALELHSQHEVSPESHNAAIDALLLAAECYINPFFVLAFREPPKLASRLNISKEAMLPTDHISYAKGQTKRSNGLETIALLESKRDKNVLQILLQAAELDREYCNRTANEEYPQDIEQDEGHCLKILPEDVQSSDAVTLVRQNQALLCHFIVRQLQSKQHTMHEILMQSLLFLLHSATELFCPPESVVDIILGFSEHLNGLLTSFYYQLKDGNLQLDLERTHELKRRWVLLQRLVVASSGGDDGKSSRMRSRNEFCFRSLVPPSSWIKKISKFSTCASPLVRFVGWMALSRHAKNYLKEGLFLASDLSQLTSLLSIFADELAWVNNLANQKDNEEISEALMGLAGVNQNAPASGGSDSSVSEGFLQVIYPDIHKFFPNMKQQFGVFGETILEAVGLQLKSLPPCAVPDALCWFSDLCLWPFAETERGLQFSGKNTRSLKGYAANNAKSIILYLLEAIVVEHMEAIVPEIPRVVQVLLSLCKSSYCDVGFLDSALRLLKPLISYVSGKVLADEIESPEGSTCMNFESLCFSALFSYIGCGSQVQDGSVDKSYQGALMIFILGSLFPDFSFLRRKEILHSLLWWADFAHFEPTSSFSDYLCAFQNLLNSCNSMLVYCLNEFGIYISVPLSPSAGKSAILCPDKSGDHSNSGEIDHSNNENGISERRVHSLKCFSCVEEVKLFSEGLQALISKLSQTVELCWNLHPQLTKRLAQTLATCILNLKCLLSICQSAGSSTDDLSLTIAINSIEGLMHTKTALEGLAEVAIALQKSHCWQVAALMLDYLLGLPSQFGLDHVVSSACWAIKHACLHAPKISWRLQSGKWMSSLLDRGLSNLPSEAVSSLVDMFCTMLENSEPELCSVALQLLERLVESTSIGKEGGISQGDGDNVLAQADIPVPESVMSDLVASTWDRIAGLASSEPSVSLKTQALRLLSGFIPFTKRQQLQSFLSSAHTLLPWLSKLGYSLSNWTVTRLSLALLASACLYSPIEDITLIPQSVWKNLEAIGASKNGGAGAPEKIACQALCQLRVGEEDAKEVLKGVFVLRSGKEPINPDFGGTRESILQHGFSTRVDAVPVHPRADPSPFHTHIFLPPLVCARAPYSKDVTQRLQQVKAEIYALEKTKLREEIAARRQKKFLTRRARQKFLEEVALREIKLLQELDRERTAEAEHEVERQRLLEHERAKTRELRHNLEMEMEKRAQREIQRELEQRESGVRPSRREYSSSTPSSRPRERYRERDNVKASTRGLEGGGSEPSTAPTPSSTVPPPLNQQTVVLAGSRSYSGSIPAILHHRDHEESGEGSRDSGDAGSVGDPEVGLGSDVFGPGFSTGVRHGGRGGKPRQMVERRERDGGRREGKWERKHS
ncbi:uncharacterized protein LOC18444006 [Amborella trichopoda]|uniref:uncharacterized protein LOC18444006 n=1 Tax=Amborella trichopoda TaxID=13333 RepID=UPI0009BD74F9|nr:uncharacterized protein LOC18444006 [Amborella trichopoda]|eukprot:XP_020528917.1 uncharacterized protein LOC18444006 [Amborella trichopoda]